MIRLGGNIYAMSDLGDFEKRDASCTGESLSNVDRQDGMNNLFRRELQSLNFYRVADYVKKIRQSMDGVNTDFLPSN